MQDELGDALKGHSADYIEIRLEESHATRIVYRGERLEEIGKTSSELWLRVVGALLASTT